MDSFTPVSALAGGALIGLAASLLLWLSGKGAGISGIFDNLIRLVPEGQDWRAAFVLGLLGVGLVASFVAPEAVAPTATRSLGTTAVAGLVVGFGVRMGSGCTSGHGVCGLSRGRSRSLAAVVAFMGTGLVVATLVQVFAGGVL